MQKHQDIVQVLLFTDDPHFFVLMRLKQIVPMRILGFPTPVGKLIALLYIAAQEARHLQRAGGIEMRIRIKAVHRIIHNAVQLRRIDEIHIIFRRNAACRIGISLRIHADRRRQMEQQHLDPPALAFLNRHAKIRKRITDLIGIIVLGRECVVPNRLNAHHELAALDMPGALCEIFLAKFAPAAMEFSDREQEFPFQIPIEIPF